MAQKAIFIQECPVCGRPLEIRKEYQGKKVTCHHCGGWFVAFDASHRPMDNWDERNDLLHRADQLLELCASGSSLVN